MGIINRLLNRDDRTTVTSYKLITEQGEGFYSYNGNLYSSDIVRSCIRPKAQAVGKAVGKHIRKSSTNTLVNPDVYIRFLLEEPNPHMRPITIKNRGGMPRLNCPDRRTSHLPLLQNAF